MADGDAPPKAKAPGEDTFTRRQVRQDMSSVPPKRAFELLQEFEPLVRREAHRFARRTRKYPWFGIEDYLSVGQIAVIEAFVCYRPESGASLKTWVGRVVKWRLAAAAGRVQDPLELQAAIQSAVRAMEKGKGTQAQVSAAYERAEAHTYGMESYDAGFSFHEREEGDVVRNTAIRALASPLPSPEELCSAKEDTERVQASLRGLEHRQQAIITSEMHGPSLTGLAGELGVSRARLYQQRGKAHGHLRRKLAETSTG